MEVIDEHTPLEVIDEHTPLRLTRSEEVHSTFPEEPNHGTSLFDGIAVDDLNGSSPHHRRRSLSLTEVLIDVTVSLSESFADITEAVTEGITEVKEEIIEVIHEEIKPVKPREEGDHSRKLSVLALSILVFYKVSGGPFGCEPTIRAAGPFYGLLGFILFPVVWCLPEAMVTAELGSAFPEPSGAIAWVEEAFGPKAGLLCGYFHWVSGATDNAIYPALFLEYVTSYLWSGDAKSATILTNEYWRFAFCTVITVVLAFVNWSGLEVVGKLSIVVAVISMSPFVLMMIFGLPLVEPSRWFVTPNDAPLVDLHDDALTEETFFPTLTMAGVFWRPFINNLYWNMNSFDVGASFAGELENSDRVFAKAMFLSVAFVMASYILPLLVAVGVSDTQREDWKAGHLTVVAGEIAGPWLASLIMLAAAVSNIALFMAELSGDAYQLMGMADRGLIPKVFCKRSRFDTPTNGILVGTLVIICLSVSDFDALVEMLNFAYSVSLLMEYVAFVKLRITDDDLERPYRIPFGTVGCILFLLPPCCICLFLIVVASKRTYVYVFILILFGICFQFLQKAGKHYHWWAYAEAPKKKRKASMKTEMSNRV